MSGGKPTEKGEARRRIRAALRDVALELSPYVFAIAAFLAGALLLASAATPALSERVRLITEVAPILVVELSHFSASIIGLLLMLVGSGLWRRRQGAYVAAIALLLAGAAVEITKGLEYGPALTLVVIAWLMTPFRKAFDRPSRLFSSRPTGLWIGATVAAVASAGALGLFAFREVAYRDELWWTFLREGDANRFLRAGVAVATLTLAVALLTLFSGPQGRRGRPTAQDIDDAARAIERADCGPADSALALVGDKDLLFSESRRSFIAFRVRAGRWIAVNEPCGLEAERRDLMWSFVEMADRAGAAPVFYRVSDELLPTLAAMGFVIREVGESAEVDTATFNLTGKSKQNLRTAKNKAAAENCFFEVLPPGSASGLADELRTVSNAWLTRQTGGEKAVTMGRFDVPYLDRTHLALVRKQGRIVAFANVMLGGGRAIVDLMRYDETAPHGIMDFMFIELIAWAKAQGAAEFSLGMAPLSGLENRRLAPVFARMGSLVFAVGGALYGFEGLRAYKAKFATDWRPLYIAARPGTIMSLALLDVALLTSGGWSGLISPSR